MNIHIPADIPQSARETYLKNFETLTHGTGRLMLFAGDQKIEHMNDDYWGEGISPENASPEHMFEIASKAKIGGFATQLGLLARYGADYPDVPYIIKMNSKTNIVPVTQSDPLSTQLWDLDQVMEFKKNSGLKIMGIGYTLYYGSAYEAQMMTEAAQLIYEAHQYGLLSVIWSYPRGEAVPNERDPHIIAGVAGSSACLGADFAKVNPPKGTSEESAKALIEAVNAAGRTNLICAGGGHMDVQDFLHMLHDQIHIAGVQGNATGRNIHQRPLEEAIRFCNAISAIVIENKSVEEAMKIFNS